MAKTEDRRRLRVGKRWIWTILVVSVVSAIGLPVGYLVAVSRDGYHQKAVLDRLNNVGAGADFSFQGSVGVSILYYLNEEWLGGFEVPYGIYVSEVTLPWFEDLREPHAEVNRIIDLLGQCDRLEELYANAIPLAPDHFRVIGQLTSLRHFESVVAWLTDDHIKHLTGLEKLESLTLIVEGDRGDYARGGFGDRGMRTLHHLDQLRHLQVYSPFITDESVPVVNGFTRLERLVLGGDGITDAGLAALKLERLQDLQLLSSSITDASIPALNRCAQLERLHLAGERITRKGVASLTLPRLKYCRLDGSDLPMTEAKAFVARHPGIVEFVFGQEWPLTEYSGGTWGKVPLPSQKDGWEVQEK